MDTAAASLGGHQVFLLHCSDGKHRQAPELHVTSSCIFANGPNVVICVCFNLSNSVPGSQNRLPVLEHTAGDTPAAPSLMELGCVPPQVLPNISIPAASILRGDQLLTEDLGGFWES